MERRITHVTVERVLECPVCMERMTADSRLLPCQHTVCLSCLNDIVSLSAGQLRCPECRSAVLTPVERLPHNMMLVRLLEGLANIPAQREAADQIQQEGAEASQQQPATPPNPPPALIGLNGARYHLVECLRREMRQRPERAREQQERNRDGNHRRGNANPRRQLIVGEREPEPVPEPVQVPVPEPVQVPDQETANDIQRLRRENDRIHDLILRQRGQFGELRVELDRHQQRQDYGARDIQRLQEQLQVHRQLLHELQTSIAQNHLRFQQLIDLRGEEQPLDNRWIPEGHPAQPIPQRQEMADMQQVWRRMMQWNNPFEPLPVADQPQQPIPQGQGQKPKQMKPEQGQQQQQQQQQLLEIRRLQQLPEEQGRQPARRYQVHMRMPGLNELRASLQLLGLRDVRIVPVQHGQLPDGDDQRLRRQLVLAEERQVEDRDLAALRAQEDRVLYIERYRENQQLAEERQLEDQLLSGQVPNVTPNVKDKNGGH